MWRIFKKQGYNIVILNFRDPEKGNSWNPLALPYMYYKQGNQDKATELLEDVSLNILYDKSEGGDSAFWQKVLQTIFGFNNGPIYGCQRKRGQFK